MVNNVRNQSFQIFLIGHIRRNKKEINLEVMERYKPALKQLEHFSHVNVFCGHTNTTTRKAETRYNASLPTRRER